MAAQIASQKTEFVDYGKLWWVTLLTGVVAAIVDVVIYFVAQALGFIGDLVPEFPESMPVPDSMPPFWMAIIGVTIIFIVIGGIVLWIIDRFSKKPISTWRIVAIVALVLSLAQPFFAFSGNDLILVGLLHIVAGVIAIYMIPSMAQKST